MKKLLYLLGMFICGNIYSQDLPEFFGSLPPETKYTIVDITKSNNNFDVFVNEHGEVSHYRSRNLSKAGKMNISLISGVEHQLYNRLSVYKFNDKGEFVDKSNYMYTMDGDSLEVKDKLYHSYSLDEIAAHLPNIFDHGKNAKNIKYLDVKNNVYERETKFDEFNLIDYNLTPVSIDIKHPVQGYNYLANDYLIDDISQTVTAIYGKRNKEIKFNEYKEHEFITTHLPSREDIASFTLNFEYPRAVAFESNVISTTTGKPIGKLFVFNRKFGIRKKYRDPEKNNFEVVYCSPNGELIFHKNTKLFTGPKGRISLYGCFGSTDTINLKFTYYEEDSLKFGIIQLPKDGEEKIYKYTRSSVANRTILDEKNSDYNKTRSVIGSFRQTPNFYSAIDVKFEQQGVTETSSNIFVWGRMVYNVDDPNWVRPTHPDGSPQAYAKAPKIVYFGEAIAFSYKKDFTLDNLFIQNLPLDSEGYQNLQLVTAFDDRIVFHLPFRDRKVPGMYLEHRSVKSESGNSETEYEDEYLYRPMIMDFSNENQKSVIFNDMYLLDLDKSLVYFDGNKNVNIVGFDFKTVDEDQQEAETVHYFKVKNISLQ